MQRRTVIGFLAFTPIVLAGCASTESAVKALGGADPLATLTSALGVSENQAGGGLGSILTLAQEKLVKGDFDKLAAAIPGASRYLDMAKSLGAVTGPVGNRAGLNSALGRLGINQETAAKFIPAVTDMVTKLGGSDVGSLLGRALG